MNTRSKFYSKLLRLLSKFDFICNEKKIAKLDHNTIAFKNKFTTFKSVPILYFMEHQDVAKF